MNLHLSEREVPMKIRSATRSDLEQIAAIHIESWKDAYRNDLPPEFIDEKIDAIMNRHWNEIEIKPQDILLVAEEDELAGFVSVWCRPAPYIDYLHVRPALRSKKIGSALMQAIAQEIVHRGHRSAYLWVFESNRKAIRFYERLGGVQQDSTYNNLFGYDVLSRKIHWDDITIVLGRR